MNESTPRKPLRRIQLPPKKPVPGAIATKISPKPTPTPVGHSLLQPATAFALDNMAKQQAQAEGQVAEGQVVEEGGRPQTAIVDSLGLLRVPEATLGIIRELKKVLILEMDLLAKQDVEAINLLLPQKYRLIGNYQANIQAIASRPDILKQAPEEIKKQLKTEGKQLDDVVSKNASALKGALYAVKRILQNIIGMIREETMPKQNTYSNLRYAKLQSHSYSPMSPSVAVDRTA